MSPIEVTQALIPAWLANRGRVIAIGALSAVAMYPILTSDLDPMRAVIAWISACGFMGLFAVALADRFVPIVPSYGLLLAVGIAAAAGSWPLPTAFFATVGGGIVGCSACFYAVSRLDEGRSTHLVDRAGRLVGLSTRSIERWSASFRRNQIVVAFSLQLVPMARFVAPGLVALLHGSPRSS